jgi:hypothetical protein
MIAIEFEASDHRLHQIQDVLVDQIETWFPYEGYPHRRRYQQSLELWLSLQ